MLSDAKDRMSAMGIKFVNVIAYKGANLPRYHTYTSANEFGEDMLYRGERPTVAHLLELARLENYNLTRLPTVNRDLHVFVGESKDGFTKRGPPKHVLLRRISHSKDALQGGLERVLSKAIEALGLAALDPRTLRKSSARVYINFLPTAGRAAQATSFLTPRRAREGACRGTTTHPPPNPPLPPVFSTKVLAT